MENSSSSASISDRPAWLSTWSGDETRRPRAGGHSSATTLTGSLRWISRSSRDLLNIIKQITDAGASFKSLRDSWADTTTAHGRLILTVLAGLAEFEHKLIVERTGEGRERAMKQGVVFGRPPKLTRHQRLEAIKRRNAGEPIRAIAQSYNVHHSTTGSQIGSGCPSWCISIASADGLSASTCS
jgi:DNA invertase Pin-like site-specific DNA recombinase